jgi:hypothetical protein
MQTGSMARSATASDLRETPYGIGIALHETNEQRRLRVWLGPALLPIFQRADVGAQISCEKAAGELHVLPDFREFVSADLRHGLRFHSMRPKRSFAGTVISQSVNPFHQLIEHDVELQQLLTNRFDFFYFREDPDVKGFFDFKVRRGTSRERNAIRVLERMGFPSKIVNAALSQLENLPKP